LNGQLSLQLMRLLQQGAHRGQSLVEFVLVMPILVLVLIGGYSMGLGTYQAHMASDAVQMPAMQKLKLSNQVTAVDGGTLQGYMNGGGLKGNFNTGALIDSVKVVNSDAYTSIMVGSKTYTSAASFIPGFTITVGEAMNKNLLEAANSGAEVRPYNTAWVPGGTPNPPP
jgi:hypothetical protein